MWFRTRRKQSADWRGPNEKPYWLYSKWHLLEGIAIVDPHKPVEHYVSKCGLLDNPPDECETKEAISKETRYGPRYPRQTCRSCITIDKRVVLATTKPPLVVE